MEFISQVIALVLIAVFEVLGPLAIFNSLLEIAFIVVSIV